MVVSCCRAEPVVVKEKSLMPAVVGWRFWYEGGATYDSNTVTWAQLPPTGVIIGVVYFDENTPEGQQDKRIMRETQRYFMFPRADKPNLYANTNESVPEIVARYPGALVLEGGSVDNATFEAWMGAARVSRL